MKTLAMIASLGLFGFIFYSAAIEVTQDVKCSPARYSWLPCCWNVPRGTPCVKCREG